MEKQQRVILFGKSVLLGTVGASLKKHASLQIISASTPYPGIQELGTLQPDVILFDLENGRPDAAFFLLATCPGLQLIGVDPDSNELLVLSSCTKMVLSVQDLVRVILKGRTIRH